MNTKKAADGILAVFFTIMLLLTLFAKDLYRLTLPKVATVTSVRKAFPDEITIDGNTYPTERMSVAVPVSVVQDGSVYVLDETEQGSFITKKEIQTGEIVDGWLEVTEGLGGKTKVVAGSDRSLKDGAEVIETDGRGQSLLHGMQETQPEEMVSSGYYRRCMRNNIVYAVILVVLTVLLVCACKLFFKEKRRFLRTLVLISWCVLVCLFIRWKVVLPGDWIPEKLIDWNGWRENIRQFPICNIVPEHSKV